MSVGEREKRSLLKLWADIPPAPKAIVLVVAFIIFHYVLRMIESVELSGNIPNWLKPFISPIETLKSALDVAVEAIAILCVVLLGSAFERHETAQTSAKLVAKQIAADRERDFGELKNAIIPGSYDHGMSGVGPQFDFDELFKGAQVGDEIDICFTYHSELTSALERELSRLSEKDCKIRLILAYDRSPATLRRFHEIEGGREDPIWAGEISEGASAISGLRTLIRNQLPALQRLHTNVLYRVSPYLTDAPFVVVRNKSSRTPYNVRFIWVGFYFCPPAVRMPVTYWRATRADASHANDESCVAVQGAIYFERRWSRAKGVDDLDQAFLSGEVWRDEFERTGVTTKQVTTWIEKWGSPAD